MYHTILTRTIRANIKGCIIRYLAYMFISNKLLISVQLQKKWTDVIGTLIGMRRVTVIN